MHILQICDEMVRRREDLAPFIDSDFDAYVEDMRKPHQWADEPEVCTTTNGGGIRHTWTHRQGVCILVRLAR